MKKGTLIAVMTAFVIFQFTLSACKKAETDVKTAPDAHLKEMIQKSFEESKKATAVTVNGEPITMFALMREMNTIAPQYLASGAKKTPELDEKVRKDALNNLIFQELAVQVAKKRGMKIKPETIEEQLKKIKTEAGSDGAFRKYLADNGLTEDDLRKSIEQDALFELIATQEVDGKITVTDAALRERYKKEKTAMKDANHKQMTFEASKGMIEQKVRTEAAEKRMREWEKELKKNAKIDIVDKQLKPEVPAGSSADKVNQK